MAKRTPVDTKARLFIGVFPGGIAYADRGREVHGDYKQLAFRSFRTGALEFYPGSKAFEEAIKAHSDGIKAGDVVDISASGQTTVMGG